jgi:hypothetical protein
MPRRQHNKVRQQGHACSKLFTDTFLKQRARRLQPASCDAPTVCLQRAHALPQAHASQRGGVAAARRQQLLDAPRRARHVTP